MAHITLLSVLSFFLIAISADIQDIIVDKYHIDIDLYPIPDNTFYIKCYVVFNNLRTTHEISMYIDEILSRPKVSMIKKDTNAKLDFETFKHNSTTRILTLFFKEKINPGLYVMNITLARFFDFAFDKVYFDHIYEEERVWLSATHFQPVWVQRIIPCWVRPEEDTSLKEMPTFNLSILHSAHHSVLTNTPIRKERLDEKALRPNIKRTYFDTLLVSPYQFSIIVTNFTRTIIDEDDVVSMWCRNRSASFLQFALTITRNITTYLHFSKKWLTWKCSTRVNLIIIPKIQKSSVAKFPEWNDSLVHPGIIIANENDITFDEENDTIGRKYNVIRLLGDKVMQECYSWIVNPYLEPNTWLSKGFATFIATHILNKIWQNFRMIDLFVVQIQHECLDFDVNNTMLPFSDQNNGIIPVEIIDNMKASVILRMLQHACIAEPFWKAIDTFTYESIIQNKKRHIKIFWRALKDAYDEIDLPYDINDFMHPWLVKKYPILSVKRNYNTSMSTMELSVNFRKEKRLLPISYTTYKNISFEKTRPSGWFNFSDNNHTLNLNYREDNWVIFNIQQTGYYRVNYDNENWRRISTYLNKEDYWKIHVLNRAQLIDDAFQFMLLGKLKNNIFWQLTEYLQRETDYIAWYPMFKAMEYMSITFIFNRQSPIIWIKLSRMLTVLLENIKYEEQLTDNDFTKALRQEAAQWACFVNVLNCKIMATNILKRHLETHTKLSLWWKKWTYCYGLIGADNIIWRRTLNKIKGDDKFLYLATCPNYLDEMSNYNIYTAITPSTSIQLQLRFFNYLIVSQLDINNHQTYEQDMQKFNNLLDQLAYIKPRQIKLSIAIIILINNICRVGHLNMGGDLMDSNFNNL